MKKNNKRESIIIAVILLVILAVAFYLDAKLPSYHIAIKVIKKAGATALAFQAGRLVLLDRESVIAYANAHNIAIVGVDSGLPPAPLRP